MAEGLEKNIQRSSVKKSPLFSLNSGRDISVALATLLFNNLQQQAMILVWRITKLPTSRIHMLHVSAVAGPVWRLNCIHGGLSILKLRGKILPKYGLQKM